MITLFENFRNYDLRQIGEFVKCIKTESYKKKEVLHYYFIKDNIYKIKGFKGNPERAMELFNINSYLPVECIEDIEVIGEEDKSYWFKNSKSVAYRTRWPDVRDYADFWNTFEIMEEVNIANKYNL